MDELIVHLDELSLDAAAVSPYGGPPDSAAIGRAVVARLREMSVIPEDGPAPDIRQPRRSAGP